MARGPVRFVILGLAPTLSLFISNVIELIRRDAIVRTEDVIWESLVVSFVLSTLIIKVFLAFKESGSRGALRILLGALFLYGVQFVAAVSTLCKKRWSVVSAVSLVINLLALGLMFFALGKFLLRSITLQQVPQSHI